MTRVISQQASTPEFETVFATLNEGGHVEILNVADEISRQAETIDMIADAVSMDDDFELVATFFSSK